MSLQQALENLLHSFGDECIRRLDDDRIVKTIPRIPSGSFKLDHILGGGWPTGRIVEIYGPLSSGKTTLALEAIANMQRLFDKNQFCCYIDTENALDPAYVKALGVDANKFYLCQPTDGDEVFEVAHQMANCGAMKVLVIDSIAGIVPRQVEEGGPSDANIAAKARLMAANIPKLITRLAVNNVLCICTNQERTNPGVQFGNPVYTPGGTALPFYSSIRVRVAKSSQTEEEEGIKVSNTVKCKCVKNKTAPPFLECEITIRYGVGIDFAPEIVDEALELNVLERRGSWFYRPLKDGKSLKLAQGKSNLVKEIRDDQNKRDKLIQWIKKARLNEKKD